MRLTKFAQACVLLVDGGRRILIDPTPLEPRIEELLAATDAVLVTHGHRDHADPRLLAQALASRQELSVWAPRDLAAQVREGASLAGNMTTVSAGDHFEAGGFPVTAFGSRHAQIHPSIDSGENVAYLVANRVYHPGDSFEVPGVPVEVLLTPTSGPWHSVGQTMDFVHAIAPRRAVQIHQIFATEMAQRLLAQRLADDVELEIVPDGQELEL